MTQVDYVISVLGQVVCKKQSLKKMSQVLSYVMLFLNVTEKIASVLGPFIKWNSRKTIKRETRLPESCVNPPAYPSRHLAQHANVDSCYE